MVASLGGYAFHSFATGLGGVVQGTAQASAGDVARGSFNAGQVNYRNVSAGTTSLGSFSGWMTNAFTSSMNQHQMDNITRQGDVVTLNKGSVGQAMAWMSKLDEPSRRILANALAIAGGKGVVSMVFNEKTGQLQSLSIVGGDGGFAVHYDGSGKFVIEKGGVKHGSVELDDSGRIKGFESSVQVGGLSLDYVKTKAKEISETAKAYGQVGEAFKTIASKGIKAVDLKSLRDNLSKIVQSDFASFLEAAKAWGVDKDIVKEIVNMLKAQFGSEFKTTDTFGANFGISGSFGLGWGGGKGGGGTVPWKAGVGADAGIEWSSTDSQIRTWATHLSKDQREALVNKFIESLQNKSGQRSSDSQAKRSEQAYTQGKDVSEEASNSKVYEVAEAFGKQAEEMLAYAERLQASLKQDPLNYYAQQKYKEALAAGKSEGEAVRYAMEEVAKLRSNPEALEKWLNEFAKEQGIQPPNVNKEELNNIPNEVPRPEDIKKEGEELRKKVAGGIDDTREKISEERRKLEKYQPPAVSPRRSEDMFRLKEDEFRLNFGLKPQNDPRFIPHANKAKEWYKNQPNPYVRFGRDVIDLGNAAGQHVVNFGEKFINFFPDSKGNKSNMPPLQGMP
jgi:hypothetical protein